MSDSNDRETRSTRRTTFGQVPDTGGLTQLENDPLLMAEPNIVISTNVYENTNSQERRNSFINILSSGCLGDVRDSCYTGRMFKRKRSFVVLLKGPKRDV
ncbi:hypothetical protein BgiMline_036386 [Biomphalaria glabrata]